MTKFLASILAATLVASNAKASTEVFHCGKPLTLKKSKSYEVSLLIDDAGGSLRVAGKSVAAFVIPMENGGFKVSVGSQQWVQQKVYIFRPCQSEKSQVTVESLNGNPIIKECECLAVP